MNVNIIYDTTDERRAGFVYFKNILQNEIMF